MLTPTIICRQALIELDKLPKLGKSSILSQKGVDFLLPYEDYTLTLDDFSERRIKPAIIALAKVIPGDGEFFPLEVPCGVTGAVETYDSVTLRFVRVYAIGADKIIGRFDVLVKSKSWTG